MPFAHDVTEVGYHDLNGRSGFKLAMQEVDGRFYLYVAALWEPGLSILDVTDPERPELLRWIAGPASTWTIQVQVADSRMVTSLEHIPAGWSDGSRADPQNGFIVWDVSTPDDPIELGRWNSGGSGTHRNFYNGGNLVHTAASMDGFEGQLYASVDISDPATPRLRGRWWWPGQHIDGGEEYAESDLARMRSGRPFPDVADTKQHSLSLHGGAYRHENRVYAPWMRAGLVILDVEDEARPALVSSLSFYPPLGSSISLHTVVPLPDRQLLLVNSEALNEDCNEPVNFAGIVDVSDESDPILISLFPQPRTPAGYPVPTFAQKGGRFGPHNQHQPQGQSCLAPVDNLVHLTYFNAGLQIIDISEPRDPFITASYIPDDPSSRRGPLPRTLVTQVEDVLVDRRGFIYISEKNTGIHILRHG